MGTPEELERAKLEGRVIEVLRTVYDPELPVNIYDLGLIYGIDIDEDRAVYIRMTLTAPALEAAIRLDAPLDLVRTVGPLLRGTGDPSMRIDPDGTVWRAMRTPLGPATLRLRLHAAELRVAALDH